MFNETGSERQPQPWSLSKLYEDDRTVVWTRDLRILCMLARIFASVSTACILEDS